MNQKQAKSCCGPDCCSNENASVQADEVRQTVREGYAAIAQAGSWTALESKSQSQGCCDTSSAKSGGGCCGPSDFTPEQLATAIGYSQSELSQVPQDANMGLSCGNPTAIASLKPGEVVLDLGSGGGFDCFVAGPKVGASGRVIGVDMTPEMISKARRNIAGYREHSRLNNVEFRLGEIENLPVADASVDVVISNCVINLSPDKPQVWREIARVLKPGGRVAASDMALLRPLPDDIRAMVTAMVGCVAGAVMLDEYKAMVEQAGLKNIQLRTKPEYVKALTSFKDPLYQKIAAALPAGTQVFDFVTSVDITATK